jgi:hypothetical protein
MKVDVKFYGPYSEQIAKIAVPTQGVFVGTGATKALATLNALDAYRLIDPVRVHKVAKLADAQRPINASELEGDQFCKVYCTLRVTNDN